MGGSQRPDRGAWRGQRDVCAHPSARHEHLQLPGRELVGWSGPVKDEDAHQEYRAQPWSQEVAVGVQVAKKRRARSQRKVPLERLQLLLGPSARSTEVCAATL